MGNLRMNADQISYKGGEKPMSVEEAIKNAGNTGLAHTADIAPDFSAESAYNAGDLVYHNGTLYVFTANHAAGAWSTEDTQAVTVGGELTSLMNGLTSMSTLNSGTLSGVRYIQAGKIVLVSIARQALSDGDSFGAPSAVNAIVAVLRDDTSGGCVQVTINTSLQINKGAGQVNFTDGHEYSGYFVYVAS